MCVQSAQQTAKWTRAPAKRSCYFHGKRPASRSAVGQAWRKLPSLVAWSLTGALISTPSLREQRIEPMANRSDSVRELKDAACPVGGQRRERNREPLSLSSVQLPALPQDESCQTTNMQATHLIKLLDVQVWNPRHPRLSSVALV